MTGYVSREAAEEVFRDARKSLNAQKYDYMANEYLTRDTMLLNAEQIIHALPAADVRSVVLCRDCKWYKVSDHLAPNRFCFRLIGADGKRIGYNFSPGDFCSYGERPNCGAEMEAGE